MFSIFNVPCYVKEFPTATANYRSHLLMLKLISSVFHLLFSNYSNCLVKGVFCANSVYVC